MHSLPNSEKHLQQVKTTAAGLMQQKSNAAVQSQETPMPESVKVWLARLSLLYGVPFEHLVANSNMLPAESIRFFYVDPNWINTLCDGALSVGVQNSEDKLIQAEVYKPLYQSVRAEQQVVRRKLAKAEVPLEVVVDMPVTGLLMRSQVVSGFPGLEIIPYENKTGDATLQVLRMERLAPDVMLCLFSGSPQRIVIREPKETLCYGVTGGLKGTGILPRYLGAKPDQPVATYVPNEPANYVRPTMRAGTTDVLNVAATCSQFKTVLDKYNALRPGTNSLTPSDFAIEMVKVAEMQTFMSGLPSGTNDCVAS